MIELLGVHKSFRVGKQEVVALQPTQLHIARGEIFGIIGHSGAGKSTLLRLINALETPSGGEIRIEEQTLSALDGAGLRRLRRRIGMIFQHFNLLSSKTVAENIAFPLKLAGELKGEALRERVSELLARVGLTEQAANYPAQLSGGQKQRVGIARALANKPTILLCDEATSALDPQTTQSILQLLADLNRELGITVVLITHEMDVIRQLCDRVAVLEGGAIVEQGAVTDVFLTPRHPTTRRFVLEAEHRDEGELHDDFARVPGAIWQLTFSGEATYQPILGRVAREAGVDFSILSGRIDRIKHTPYGQLLLAVSGGDSERALAGLQAAGIRIEVMRA